MGLFHHRTPFSCILIAFVQDERWFTSSTCARNSWGNFLSVRHGGDANDSMPQHDLAGVVLSICICWSLYGLWLLRWSQIVILVCVQRHSLPTTSTYQKLRPLVLPGFTFIVLSTALLTLLLQNLTPHILNRSLDHLL
jgi:hypothetical protein